METGNYVLNLKVNDTKLSKEFTIDYNEINIGKSAMRFDPYFDFTNNQLKLSYLNFDQDNLNLSIYNNEGLIYKSNLGNDFAVNSGYDLSGLEPGKYDVTLYSLDNEYTFSLVK